MSRKLRATDGLFIAPAVHGRGVFTSKRIERRRLIGEYPYVVVPYIDELRDYVFELEGVEEEAALVIGYGSIMNHSDRPNVLFRCDEGRECFVFTSKRVIRPGEELLIDYGPTWFEDRDLEKL